MINLRSVYLQSEEKMQRVAFALFGLLALFLIIQSFFSPAVALASLGALVVLIVTVLFPTIMLAFLALYLPFEPFVLKFIPDSIYVFGRFFSEGLIYLIAFVVFWRLFTGKIRLQQTTLDAPFVLFVITLVASALIHFVPVLIALLGLRQILRFMIVFFLVVYLQPSKLFIKKLTTFLFIVLLIEAGIGITQAMIGDPLDQLLISSEARTLGDLTLTGGVEQFWDPGSRVFATLGRYDRLGNFLYIFLLIASGFLFTLQARIKKLEPLLWWVFLLGIPTLVLTYSRSSWFGFLLGFVFIGLIIKRDKKVFVGLVASAVIILGYLAVSGLTVGLIAEGPGQTLSERFFESFSYTRWRGEYEGVGRIFWYVHTPLDVVAASPVFGWGPGQFGGGAVAALHNTRVYDELALPYGIFGTEGFIDTSWFALWGEAGTLGLFFFLWMYIALYRRTLETYHSARDPYVQGLAIGFAAVLLAITLNALTSTIFEIRTVAFYVWLYGGFVWVLGEKKKNEKHV